MLDSELAQVQKERAEFEQRCIILESELTSRAFSTTTSRNALISESEELQEIKSENNYLREQLDVLAAAVREIEEKGVTLGRESKGDPRKEQELDRLRTENSKLKLD